MKAAFSAFSSAYVNADIVELSHSVISWIWIENYGGAFNGFWPKFQYMSKNMFNTACVFESLTQTAHQKSFVRLNERIHECFVVERNIEIVRFHQKCLTWTYV